MNFYSGGPRGTERWWGRRNPVLAKPAPQEISGRRVRCRGDPGRPLTLGTGLGACPLPRLQDQVQQEEGGRAWGRHGDSSAPRGLCGRQWRGSAGQGAVHGPRAASGTGGGWGGAQPSVGRWLLGSAGRNPRFMVQRPRGKGEGGGRTESGRPPWPGSPICREERGRREPGAGATEGAETRPNWSEVDGGKGCGWAPGHIVKGRNEEGVGYRGWAERAKTEEASVLLS